MPLVGRHEVLLVPGSRVGSFRIEVPLAKSDSYAVFAARGTDGASAGREVQLKVFRLQDGAFDDTDARFAREAWVLERIASTHIPDLVATGHVEGGAPFIATELLEGQNLEEILRMGPLRIPHAARYVSDAARGLYAAHEAGFIHGEISTAKLLLANRAGEGPVLKILDFGVGSAESPMGTDEIEPRLTDFFTAPEQLTDGQRIDARADIWALGVVLFRLLNDNWPFRGETLGELKRNILQRSPARVHARRPDVDAGLEKIVLTCLAKAACERFTDARELSHALEPYTREPDGKRVAELRARAAMLLRMHSGERTTRGRES
jgi:serine/threonine-protein kinase